MTSTNNHINNYELDELPISIPQKENSNYKYFEEVVTFAGNIKEEINASDLRNIDISKLVKNIDEIVVKLYNLSRQDLEYIYSILEK